MPQSLSFPESFLRPDFLLREKRLLMISSPRRSSHDKRGTLPEDLRHRGQGGDGSVRRGHNQEHWKICYLPRWLSSLPRKRMTEMMRETERRRKLPRRKKMKKIFPCGPWRPQRFRTPPGRASCRMMSRRSHAGKCGMKAPRNNRDRAAFQLN